MADFGYRESWPDSLKELSRKHYRACCRARNLENFVEHVDPWDFDDAMNQLERAQADVIETAIAFQKAQQEWDITQMRCL